MSKHTPLPTSVIFGCAGSPQVMSISRGARGGAADRVDQREVLLQQIVADDRADAGAVPAARAMRAASSSSAGPMSLAGVLIRSRASEHALDDAREIFAVDAGRQIELHALLVGLAVAREAVGAEREG